MHAVLKHETAQLHRHLNRMPNARALLKEHLGLDQYTEVLIRFARAYNHIERQLIPLERKINLGRVGAYVPRLAPIISDIASFNGGGISFDDTFDDVRVPLHASTREHYFGIRYVIDGSTQGGKLIERKLRQHLPTLPEQAFAFWRAQSKAALDWELLCSTLDQLPGTADCHDNIVRAANSAFASFIHCLGSAE